jgi:hypothetical protein
MGWYLDPIRVNPDALDRAKSIVAEALKTAYSTPGSRFTCEPCGGSSLLSGPAGKCDYCGKWHNKPEGR